MVRLTVSYPDKRKDRLPHLRREYWGAVGVAAMLPLGAIAGYWSVSNHGGMETGGAGGEERVTRRRGRSAGAGLAGVAGVAVAVVVAVVHGALAGLAVAGIGIVGRNRIHRTVVTVSHGRSPCC